MPVSLSAVPGVIGTAGFAAAEAANRATVLSGNTEDTNAGNGWMKIKAFTMKCRNGSSFYLTWDARHAGADVNPKTGIFVNGVNVYQAALGGGGAYVGFTYTVSGINDGDEIGFYVSRDNGGGTVALRNAVLAATLHVGKLSTGTI